MARSEGVITADGRNVVVTHREPIRIIERDGEPCVERSSGGLIAALEPAMHDGDALWISADIAERDHPAVQSALEALPYEWRPVSYSDEEYESFYLGFSNRALWPLYHSMLGTAEYHRTHWAAYQSVNQRFADVTSEGLREDDMIWVHDYQLSLVPDRLRKNGLPAGARIGFFSHIPFPPFDLFRTLPWAREILEGMLGASLVAFHVAEYVNNFFDSVEQLLALHCDRLRGRVKMGDRFVNVRSVPIGIDVDQMYAAVRSVGVKARAQEIREELSAEHLLVGIDRLDYTKGIFHRLRGLEAFYEAYPEYQGKVSLVQLAVPSRSAIGSYQDLREEIERAVGHINGLYARAGWTPVTYMYRSIPFEELAALYLAADAGLVTPLRDGMNLVAKEYVAAHVDRPGVLILSELAGAAQQLTEAELVNPYDLDGMAQAIKRALEMDEDTARRRMRKMNAKVRRFDVRQWLDTLLSEAIYVD